MAVYVLAKYRHRGALELAFLVLASAAWALFYGFELQAVDLPGKFFWGKHSVAKSLLTFPKESR